MQLAVRPRCCCQLTQRRRLNVYKSLEQLRGPGVKLIPLQPFAFNAGDDKQLIGRGGIAKVAEADRNQWLAAKTGTGACAGHRLPIGACVSSTTFRLERSNPKCLLFKSGTIPA